MEREVWIPCNITDGIVSGMLGIECSQADGEKHAFLEYPNSDIIDRGRKLLRVALDESYTDLQLCRVFIFHKRFKKGFSIIVEKNTVVYEKRNNNI